MIAEKGWEVKVQEMGRDGKGVIYYKTWSERLNLIY